MKYVLIVILFILIIKLILKIIDIIRFYKIDKYCLKIFHFFSTWLYKENPNENGLFIDHIFIRKRLDSCDIGYDVNDANLAAIGWYVPMPDNPDADTLETLYLVTNDIFKEFKEKNDGKPLTKEFLDEKCSALKFSFETKKVNYCVGNTMLENVVIERSTLKGIVKTLHFLFDIISLRKKSFGIDLFNEDEYEYYQMLARRSL